ncbi:MAG: hypothetical protein RRY97_00315 [Oscillibacter sp.]
MDNWVTWIIQVVAYGIICFLLKRELAQLDERFKRLNDRIDTVEKKTADDIDAVEKKLNETISGLPFQYTLREDFIRSVAGFDAKLDKILDQLNRRQ